MEEKREIIYSDLSSASRKQPHDAMVYLEGDQVIAIDGNGKIIAKGVAGEDDTTVIQAAFDNLPARGTLTFDGNEYSVNSIIETSKSVTIRGMNSTLICSGPGRIYCHGTEYERVDIAEDIPAGSNQVKFVDPPSSSTVFEGSLILIYDDTIWCSDALPYPTQKTGELHEVKSVTGNVVTLSDNTINGYSLEKIARAFPIVPISVTISDLNMTGPGESTETIGISLDYCNGAHINNCNISDFGIANMWISHAYSTVVSNCRSARSLVNGYGYGINTSNASAHVKIQNCHIESCRHAIACGTSTFLGQTRDIQISGNTINTSHADGAVDAHPTCESISIENNYITNRLGAAIWVGAKNIVIVGNTVTGSIGIRTPIEIDAVTVANNLIAGKGGIFSCNNFDTTIKRLQITDNTSSGNTQRSEILVICKHLTHGVISNNVTGTSGHDDVSAIVVYCGSDTPFKRLIISGNTIPWSNRAAIFCRNGVRCDITGNTIINPGQNTTSNSWGGMYIQSVQKSNISSNNIYTTDEAIKNPYCAIEGVTSGALYIVDNIFDCTTTTTPIVVGDTATATCKRNVGYVTENSGSASISSGSTSVNVSHGCRGTPTNVSVTPLSLGSATKFWVSDIGTTTFKINVDADPSTGDATFHWKAEV